MKGAKLVESAIEHREQGRTILDEWGCERVPEPALAPFGLSSERNALIDIMDEIDPDMDAATLVTNDAGEPVWSKNSSGRAFVRATAVVRGTLYRVPRP